MKIDYSVNKKESVIHPLYSNFVFGARHLALACSKNLKLPVSERIKHFILGIFELLPILGHVISVIDRRVSHIHRRILILDNPDPYQRGITHGEKYRSAIQTLCRTIFHPTEGWILGHIDLTNALTPNLITDATEPPNQLDTPSFPIKVAEPQFEKYIIKPQSDVEADSLPGKGDLYDYWITLITNAEYYSESKDCDRTAGFRQQVSSSEAMNEAQCAAAILHKAIEHSADKHRIQLKYHGVENEHPQYITTNKRNYLFYYITEPPVTPEARHAFTQDIFETVAQELQRYDLGHLQLELKLNSDLSKRLFGTVTITAKSEESAPYEEPEATPEAPDGSVEEVTPPPERNYPLTLESLDEWVRLAEQRIPEEYRQEMRGIAEGAGVSYREIVMLNIFNDLFPQAGACSTFASTLTTEGKVHTCAVTNHFAHEDVPCKRLAHLESIPEASVEASPLIAHHRAMRAVDQSDTIQTIVFDVDHSSLKLSTSRGRAAKKTFTPFSQIFPDQSSEDETHTFLSRNFDGAWPVGPDTLVIVREGVASIAWPGFVCAPSGMNQHGLSMAVCTAGKATNLEGTPNLILFQQMLRQATTVKEAIAFLERSTPASSINLTLAGKDGIARVEIDPARIKQGPALVVRG